MKREFRDPLFQAKSIFFEVSSELRALAHLFDTQAQQQKGVSNHDSDEISRGLGSILKKEVRRLHQAKSILEKI